MIEKCHCTHSETVMDLYLSETTLWWEVGNTFGATVKNILLIIKSTPAVSVVKKETELLVCSLYDYSRHLFLLWF